MPYAKYDGKDPIYKDKEQLLKKTSISITDPILPPKNLVKLTGTLSEFKGLFCYAPLADGAYLSDEQKQKHNNQLRKGALLATLNGNSIAALAGLGHANGNDRSNYVDAQYITAKLNSTIILKGWIGFYKFNDGDQVEVVAEKHDDHYEVYAMLKPSEQIISLVPLCFAGRNQALKYNHFPMFIFYVICVLLMNYFFLDFSLENLTIGFGSLGVIFWLAIFNVYKNSIATHITLAERIFTVLGWQDVKNINLVKISRQYVAKLIAQEKYAKEYNNKTDPHIRPPKSGGGWYFFYYDPDVLCKKGKPPLRVKNKKRK
ncbi:putative type VI secretion system effector [Gilliamella bombi]|uniref:putative type VI secretion system effector n=1 Tax=Gilliamella bombi TaxID=1908521 RepID=UPI000A1639E5|nr:putative type VI secretion system effector [Gilliamella bombi]